MKKGFLFSLILLFLVSCSASTSNSASDFNNYINKLVADNASTGLKIDRSFLHQNKSDLELKSVFDTSSINKNEIVTYTEQKLNSNEMELGQPLWVIYYLATFSTESAAANVENILKNKINKKDGTMFNFDGSEIYRNGKELFFIYSLTTKSKKLVSTDIRNKGKELIGLK